MGPRLSVSRAYGLGWVSDILNIRAKLPVHTQSRRRTTEKKRVSDRRRLKNQ